MPRAHVVVSSTIRPSARVLQLRGIFDVPPAAESRVEWDVNLPLEERPWSVGLIVGPSGAGKSTVARELFGSDQGANLITTHPGWPGRGCSCR